MHRRNSWCSAWPRPSRERRRYCQRPRGHVRVAGIYRFPRHEVQGSNALRRLRRASGVRFASDSEHSSSGRLAERARRGALCSSDARWLSATRGNGLGGARTDEPSVRNRRAMSAQIRRCSNPRKARRNGEGFPQLASRPFYEALEPRSRAATRECARPAATSQHDWNTLFLSSPEFI